MRSGAQSVTGDWYGIGTVEKDGNYSQYLSELTLVQRGNIVTGEYNYFFKNAYVPSKVSGTYNSKTRLFELNIFPLLNFKAANVNGADCPMKGVFILRVSKVETILTGKFETTDHYKYTCPAVTFRFKKETLLNRDTKKPMQAIAKELEMEADEQEAIAQKRVAVPGGQPSKTIDKTIAKKTDTSTLKKVKRPVAKKESVATNTEPQPVVKVNDLKLKEVIAPPLIPPPVGDLAAEALTAALTKRSFEESRIIEVDADSLVLTLYDNGEVDGDTVALFHNRKLVRRGQRLSDKPISLTIQIDTTVHEISMYAENLGTIPPNTALCIFMAGNKRYELILTSNFIRNGTIRFRKKTKAQIEAEKEYFK